MSDDFELFTGRAIPVVERAMVTIQRKGTMSLNHAAFQALGEPAAVAMFFNKAKRIVGIRAIDPAESYAYPVRKQAASRNYVLAGQAFTKTYGIDTTAARRYNAELRPDGMLVIDLEGESLSPVRHD